MDVQVLGPVEASVDGRSISLGGGKPRALLAMLALNAGSTVSTERLIDDSGEVRWRVPAHRGTIHAERQRRWAVDRHQRRRPGAWRATTASASCPRRIGRR